MKGVARGVQQYSFDECPHQVKRVVKDIHDKFIFVCLQCNHEV